MRRLCINPIPCTGCLNCEVVCAQTRAGDHDRRASAVKVMLDPFRGDHDHIFCRQCESSPCARTCPEEAITRDDRTGAWVIDRELCRRCGNCVQACPFKAMFWWDSEHGPVKCDLCSGKVRCVGACSFRVIRYLEQDDPETQLAGIPDDQQDPLLGKASVEIE